jgi:tetratricopeptide (TPR) repeat protein
MPLESTELQHLRSACGYVELGMYLDADAEVETIDPFYRALPEVLAVRLIIYAGLQKWELMQVVAEKLARHDPNNVQWSISWAYATRRVESVEAARAILLETLKTHPDESTIHYNLACYECQLGNLDGAEAYLARATTADPKFTLMALEDKDLQPLWAEIGRLEV